MAGNNVRGNGAVKGRPAQPRAAVAMVDSLDREERAVTPAPKWLGKRVGRFKLVGVLGEGAMGKVFRAEDTLLGRYAALKVLPKTYKRGGKSIAVERLIREARAAASLHHPNAVTIYEVNEAKGIFYIAMEVVEGGSLHQLVRSAGPLDYPRACLLAADAGDALAQAHLLGIVHRDVKPANLMLTRAGRCKVVDFGLAHLSVSCDESLLFSGSVGTPHFIAPEVARGGEATARSDIYSLGATMWYLLTGKPPYEGATTQELLKKHIDAKLPDLAALRPDLPAGLVQAMLAALEKDPNERLASVEEFARAVRVYTIGTDGGMASSAVVGWSSGMAMAGGSRIGLGSVGAKGVGSPSMGARSMGARSSGTSKSGGVVPVAAGEPTAASASAKKRWMVIAGCAAAAAAGVVAVVLVAGNRGGTAGAKAPVAAAVKRAAEEPAKDAATPAASVEAPVAAAKETPAAAAVEPQAVDVQPAGTAKSGGGGSAPTRRGQSLVRKGQFEAALAEFGSAIAANPNDAMAWYETAQIKLYLGDQEGYRRACKQMVEQLGKGLNKTAAQRAARASLLSPDSGIDVATSHRLTDQALAGNWAQDSVLGGFQMTKAMAEYRSGQFANAVQLLNQAGTTLTAPAERATMELLLAMSYQGMGKTAERDAAAKRAAELLDGPVGGADELASGVENWLTCQIVRNEAAKLLGPIGSNAEKAAAVLPAGKKGKGSSPTAQITAKAQDLLRYGKFPEAIAQCDKAIEVNDRDHTAWYLRSMLKLYTGDVRGYQDGCRAMLDKFGKIGTDQGGRAVAGQRAARVCLMTPEMSKDTDLLTKLSDQAIASEPEARLLAFFKITRGMADYRAGRYEAAIKTLQEANADLPGAAERATTQLLTAMSYAKMGKADDAAATMQKATDLIDGKLVKPGSDELGPGAENWVICQIVKREADRVVGK